MHESGKVEFQQVTRSAGSGGWMISGARGIDDFGAPSHPLSSHSILFPPLPLEVRALKVVPLRCKLPQ